MQKLFHDSVNLGRGWAGAGPLETPQPPTTHLSQLTPDRRMPAAAADDDVDLVVVVAVAAAVVYVSACGAACCRPSWARTAAAIPRTPLSSAPLLFCNMKLIFLVQYPTI